MADVLFYHLTESTLENALPALLEKTVQRGWRAIVQTGSEERRDGLDIHLWTYRDDSFLAHGTDREPHADAQPILLTVTQDNRNAASIRFVVDGAAPPPAEAYERMVFMFDGHDAAQVEEARSQWKVQKAAGHTVTYWQQTPERRWERKA
ncbi:DNA polymerase III subunit chi [Mesorhizobium sp. CN2-181]|uniref:DNA polymerase III subunit chi n=1 Tax=Mesorhizobium yinganensis TaxID=3157707 RepID=UPI0032B71BA0